MHRDPGQKAALLTVGLAILLIMLLIGGVRLLVWTLR
jgi:hypothetical protein